MEKDDVVELGLRIERLEKQLDHIVRIMTAGDHVRSLVIQDYWALRKQAEQGL